MELKEFASLFISNHGYTGLYLYFVFDTLGVLLPSKSILTLIGFLVGRGIFSFVPVVLTAAAGSLTGVTVSYFIGRKIGNPFFEKYGRFIRVTPEKLSKAERWADKYGAPAIVLAYFVPGLRHITPYISGITMLPYWKVILFSAVGALLWVTVFLNLGLFLGDIWDRNAGY